MVPAATVIALYLFVRAKNRMPRAQIPLAQRIIYTLSNPAVCKMSTAFLRVK